MMRNFLVACLGGVILAAGAAPVFAQTAPDRKLAQEKRLEREREHKARQDSAKPSTVVLVRAFQEASGIKLVVSPPGDSGRTTVLTIQAVKDDVGRPEPDPKQVEIAKVLVPGKKFKVYAYSENSQMWTARIALLDEKGEELSSAATAQYIQDFYAHVFEKFSESVVNQKPQITVTLSKSGANSTYQVNTVRDAQGVWAPDTALVDRIRSLKKGDKVEFRLVPGSNVLRSIRLSEEPDQGSFVSCMEKMIDGRKGAILQFKDAGGLVDSFATRDSHVIGKAKQLQPGQSVEYRTKAEGDLVLVTQLDLPGKLNDHRSNTKVLGEKPAKLK